VRIISSVHETDAQQTGLLDQDTVAALCDRIDTATTTPTRESFCSDKIGQRTFEVVLTSYTAPEGELRWAVYTSDNLGSAYLDSDDRAEAEARYEEEVRDLASCAHPTMYAWWDHTDVDGLKQCGYHYRLDVRDGDGDWTTREEGTGTLGAQHDHEDYQDAAIRLARESLPYNPEGYPQARVEFRSTPTGEPVATEVVDLDGE